VPPQGYLEVESRNSPTSPRALQAIARAAVKAGLSWDRGRPLPVQRFVGSQERARLLFQARRELPRVTAVASQVMLVDRRLAQAEEALRQAVGHRSAAAQSGATAPVADRLPSLRADDSTGWRPSDTDPGLERSGWPPMLGPWSEAAILAVVAGGQAVLAATAAHDSRLGPLVLGLLAGAAAVGSVVAAQLAARGLHHLAASAEGFPDPRRRRLDVTVAGGALACGVTLTVAVGQLGSRAGPPLLGLALLGLATAASYAAAPLGAAPPGDGGRWPAGCGDTSIGAAPADGCGRPEPGRRPPRWPSTSCARSWPYSSPSCLPPNSRRCCSGATRSPSATPPSTASSSSWPPTAGAGPAASGGRSPTGGAGRPGTVRGRGGGRLHR
jgi:hypothetical protein